MAEATATQEAKAEVAIPISDLLTGVPTMFGITKIYNQQLVSLKFLQVVNLTLQSFESDLAIMAVVFSDMHPIGKYGAFDVATKTVVINLAEHWTSAAELVKNPDHYLSIRGHLWYNMLTTWLHEAAHAEAHLTDAELYSEMSTEAKEEMGDEEAINSLEKLGIHFDIEPPAMRDEPFFGTRYMQLFLDSIQNGTDGWADGWAVRQNGMHDEIYIYCDEMNDVLVKTFREYLRGSIDTKKSNPEWDKIQPTALPAVPAVTLETIKATSTLGEMVAVNIPVTIAALPDMSNLDQATLDALDENIVEPEITSWETDDRLYDMAFAHLSGDEGAVMPAQTPGLHIGPAAHELPPWTVEPQPAMPEVSIVAGSKVQCVRCQNMSEAAVPFCSNCGNQLMASGTVGPTIHGTTGVPAYPNPVVTHPVPTQAQPWNTAYNPATMAPGARGGRTNEVLRTGLPHNGLNEQQINSMLFEVWTRMYNFLFTKCGWQLPLTQAMIADPNWPKDGFHPNLRHSVMSGIDVGDIPGIERLIIAVTEVDPTNIPRKANWNGGKLRGWVSKHKHLPMFALYLNINGSEIKRLFVPQDPYKIKTDGDGSGQYTFNAVLAQQGNRFAYVMDGNDNLPFKEKFRRALKNGMWE